MPDATAGPPRARCGSFRAGHDVHHIQARLAAEQPPSAVEVVIGDDGWIDLRTPSGRERRWTHDPAFLRGLLVRRGGTCELRDAGVLAFPAVQADGTRASTLVSVATEPSDCPAPAPDTVGDERGGLTAEDLLDQLTRRGGFLVAGDAIRPSGPEGGAS